MSYVPILSTDAASALAGARVLVTGGSGFVGRHVVQQGVAAGVEVHTLGRRAGPEGSVHHIADLADGERTRSIVREVAPDVLIKLASPGVAFGTATFLEMLRVLVLGAEALLSAACELGRPPKIIHVGTGFEYADQERPIVETDALVPSASRYGAAKAAASAAVGSFADALAITLLRPFNVYGAGDAAPRLGSYLIEKARARETLDVTASAQVRDFLHVDDCSRCLWIAAAAQSPDPGLLTLNVGSGKPIPLRSYIEGIVNALGRAGITCDVRFGARPYRAGEPMISVPDLSRLNATLDWQPKIDLAWGTNDFVEWSLAR